MALAASAHAFEAAASAAAAYGLEEKRNPTKAKVTDASAQDTVADSPSSAADPASVPKVREKGVLGSFFMGSGAVDPASVLKVREKGGLGSFFMGSAGSGSPAPSSAALSASAAAVIAASAAASAASASAASASRLPFKRPGRPNTRRSLASRSSLAIIIDDEEDHPTATPTTAEPQPLPQPEPEPLPQPEPEPEEAGARLVAAQRECEQALEKVESLGLRKAAVRVELKEWQADFEQRVGRAPSDLDKGGDMGDRFSAFQRLTAEAKQAAKDAAFMQRRLQKIKREVLG